MFFCVDVYSKVPSENDEIILGCETSLLTAPVWVAENEGYFDDAGVSVKIKEFESGKASFTSMLHNNDVHISTVAQTPIMFNSFARNDFAILGAMVSSDNDVKVLVRNGQLIMSVEDLIGKKIGVTKGSTGQFFLDLFLSHGHVLPQLVEVVDFRPSELPQALMDGAVDGICTWEPHIIIAQRMMEEKVFILPSKGIYREDFYFVANKEFIKTNTGKLMKFLSAIKKAEDFILKNKRASMEIVSERLDLEEWLTALTWDVFEFQLKLDQSILLSLEDEARWALKEGYVEEKEIPNYLDFLYIDVLEKLDPEAVTVIR